ncbi:MAG: nucleotide exchange factor GrpE [Candidatus Marinimicrobia bacterium]|nr:nucleotide exchange factor GrpE [Candidatus Neomarinimicrobiota bacterium]|tara:strand:- start:6805 stop:7398 length:594 start_codon:yes stop_codon:yes gene_type:complete
MMTKKKTKKQKAEKEIVEDIASDEILDKKDSDSSDNKIVEDEQKISVDEELNNLRDRHLRLRAEFDNYKKRSEREFSRLLKYQGEDVIISFLGIADDVQRMLDSADTDGSKNVESLLEGVALIRDKLIRKLNSLEVEPFDSEGMKFDPEIHDAMMTQFSEKDEDGIIIQEFEKGFKYKDKVIRHAKVIVNSKEATKE